MPNGLVTANQYTLQPDLLGAVGKGAQLAQGLGQLRQQQTQQALQPQVQALRGQLLGGDPASPGLTQDQAFAQLGSIAPDDLTQIQAQEKQRFSQQSAESQEEIKSIVQGAAQVEAIPTISGKLEFLNKRREELIARGSPHQDTDQAISFYQQGKIEEADQFIGGAVQLGERLGLLNPDRAAPAPVIREGLTQGGDPAFLSITPEGATPIPGAGPAPKAPLVSVNTKGEGKEREEIAKVQAGRFSEVVNEARLARTTIATLDQLDAIDVKTGALEPAKAAIAGVIKGLGFDDIASQVADISSAQSYNAVTSRMINEVLNAATGPQTDGDAQRAKKTIETLGGDPLANQFKSNSLRALAFRKIEQGDFIENLIDEGATFSQANKKWNKFKNQTPSLSGVVRSPETGLPVFFYEFKNNAQRVRPGISEAEIIDAWREVNAK